VEFADADGVVYAVRLGPVAVWRVGYRPDPWAWTDWSYARGGRFGGRWDSPDGGYRTIYAGSSLLACLVEVLAPFRPDPLVSEMQDGIREDDADRALHPTVAPGFVDESWFAARRVGTAELRGRWCDVAKARTLSSLRPAFVAEAIGALGLEDFDASALQNSRPRALTQNVGRHLYERRSPSGDSAFDGIRFLSRHGEDLELWAVFERADDPNVSGRLHEPVSAELPSTSPEVRAALMLHGLTTD